MTCQEAQRMIPRYIKKELTRQETDDFLTHVMSCKECYDELEIYYTIDAALRELDGDTEDIQPLKEAIEISMKESRTQMRATKMRWDVYYASSTVVFWTVLAAVIADLYRIYVFAMANGWLELLHP